MRTTRILSLLALQVVVLVAMTGPSFGATLRVPSEYPKIQAGVDAASPGDTVLVAPGTYADFETRVLPPGASWTSCVFLKDGVVVRSEGGSSVTRISLETITGPQRTGINARFLPSTATALEGFLIEGPRALGAYVFYCGDVTFKDCVFRNFDGGPTSGGAMIVNGNVTIDGCSFTNCVANNAGAVLNYNGRAIYRNVTFEQCGNNAIYADESNEVVQSEVLVEDCAFAGNFSDGGAALVISKARAGATVLRSLFRGNSSSGAGSGAIGIGSQTPTLIEDCVFIDNHATGNGNGGAIDIGPSLSTIQRNTFVGNSTAPGNPAGAIHIRATCYLRNNVFVANIPGAAVDPLVPLEESTCNVFWDNPGGAGYPLSPTDRIVDPQFCDLPSYDLTLRFGSPCLSEDPLGCGQIGAFGQGCGTVSVESKSWGEIKGVYSPKWR